MSSYKSSYMDLSTFCQHAKVYVIDESNYGKSVLESPTSNREAYHLRLNQTSMENAATFLSKKSKLNKLIVDLLDTDDFKDNFRYIINNTYDNNSMITH